MTVRAPELDVYRIIHEGTRILGLPLEPSVVIDFVRYIEILKTWRTRTNLTSVKNDADIAILHFLDSMTIFKVIPYGTRFRILDVASGAGFPGLVIRIADSSKEVALLDRDPKKIVFLKHVAAELGLESIEYLNVDLRTFLDGSNQPMFDLVVSRAFSSSPEILDTFSKSLNPDGHMIRMAGPRCAEKPFPLRHFRQSASWQGKLPFSSHFRRVILYERA